MFGRRQDEVFLKLKALSEPFGVTCFYTDYWDAYTRRIEPDQHQPGEHLRLRTRIKRLTRKTICCSKLIQMHDIVIGLCTNRYEFGLRV